MLNSFIALVANLLTADISIWLAAKGVRIERSQEEYTNKIAIFLFTKYKKSTKMPYLVLMCNLFLVIVSFVMALAERVTGAFTVANILLTLAKTSSSDWHIIIIGLILIAIKTIVFMVLTYRAVEVSPIQDHDSGNRYLTVNEIDEEYIKFSMPENIDARSTLVLIAGDLSFLGDVPEVETFTHDRQKRKCARILAENNATSRCAAKRCPVKPEKCIERSGQFSQLLELHNRGIKLFILCKEPKASGDVVYKRRLGRLKKIFGEDLQIRFLPDESLGSNVCILGRVKRNGGIEELFWHWKKPNDPGMYTVPATKRGDTSENRTLIFLLSKVLWEAADLAPEEAVKGYVQEYEKAIQCQKK